MTDSSAKLPDLWLLTTAVVSTLLVVIGMRMILELFAPPVVNLIELNMTQFSLIIVVFQLMWGISQFLSGALADRFGAFKALASGTVLLIIACLMVPQMPTYWGLILGIGLLLAFGTGSGGFSIIMGRIAAKTPPRRRGLTFGPVNAGGSAGQLLFVPLVQGLIALPHVGWTGIFYAWAVTAILILPISQWLAGGRHAARTVRTDDDDQTLKQVVCRTFANRSYILLHSSFFICGFRIAFLVTHLPIEISLCDLPIAIVSTPIAIINLASIAGCIFSGWCISRFLDKYILFGLYASRTAMMLIYLATPKADLSFYLFAAGLGFTWLTVVTPTVATTGRLFNTRYLATFFGLTMLNRQIGSFLGSYIGSIVITRFDDYGWMWYAGVVLAGAATLLNLLTHERRAAAA